MKKIKIFGVMIFLLSILAFSVVGVPTWWNEGNEMARYGAGGNYWLFASPYTNEADNTDFASYTITEPHDSLIISNLLNEYGSVNYFYYFSGTSVYYTDIEGDVQDTYYFAENVKRIDVINLNSDSSLELLVYHGDYLTALTLDENFKFEFVRSWDLESIYNVDHYVIDFTNSLVFYVENDIKNISKIDLENGITTNYYNENIYYSLDIDKTIYLKIDTNYNLYYFYPYSYKPSLVYYAYFGFAKYYYYGGGFEEKENRLIIPYSGGTSSSGHKPYVIDVKIFNLNNNPYFLFNVKVATLEYYLKINSIGTEQHEHLKPKIFVGDVNKNGFNELCSNYATYLLCENNEGDLVFNIHLEDAITTGTQPVLGNYNNDSDYMNIITPCGVYEVSYLDSTNLSTTKIYNLSYACTDTEVTIYPVGMYDKQTFIKDLITAKGDDINLYISAGEESVCGDGVCDIGETMVTCPSDCLSTNTTYSFNIENVIINPSINAIIKNGSRLEVIWDVVPSEPNLKYQTKVSISYDDGLNYTSTEGWSNINQFTTTFSSNFILNQLTETGKIKIEVRIFGQDTLETKVYTFIVRSSGVSYGDVVYSEGETQTERQRDNVIYNTLLVIGSMLNLSVSLLAVFIIFIVMIAVLFYQRESMKNGLIASVMIGFIMLILFVIAGALSVGILISILIVGLIVLGIGFTNKISGER